MPDARVIQARIADPNIKSKCNYCGTVFTETQHLDLEIEYQGVEMELYNTVLLCEDVKACQSRGFYINVERLSRYMTPSLIDHYEKQTLNKRVFSPLNRER